MKEKQIIALALLACMLPVTVQARGYGGSAPRPSGGFDFHGDSSAHTSTGPAGTTRTGTTTDSGGTYTHTSNASNGTYNHSSSTSANGTTGNYSRSASGSSAYGSYNTGTSGNAYNHAATHSTNATNAYGQTYSSTSTAHNGYVTTTKTVTNPVYGGYSAWGWNAGYAWAPVPYYYGGGFWGPFAIGAATAAAWGAYTYPNNVTVTSYQAQPDSAGAKLLSSYKLTQTPCGPPGLVVIMGPNNSVICAKPNSLVSAGTYSVNEQSLTLVSVQPKS